MIILGAVAGVGVSLLGIWAWIWWQFMGKPCREHRRYQSEREKREQS